MKYVLTGAVLALLASLVLAADRAGGKAQHVQSFMWRMKAQGFGGFSGFDFIEGDRFIALSDRGAYVEGRLIREHGRIKRIESTLPVPLRDAEGMPYLDGDGVDSEGLAIRDDGRRFVSFEGRHRVWAYLKMDQAAWLSQHPDFQDLQMNSALEALAVDRRGWLYTLPERSGQLTRPFPVYRYRNGRWDQPFAISRLGGFLPVGADFGPDDQLYILEREFTGFGFRSRVRRFSVTRTGIGPGEILFSSPNGRHDNLEGLAVSRTAGGKIRLTMISDDNFRIYQRKEIVEYVVH